ncbi:MBL fold metallo-hydrolase [Candidatus Woesearchaeota archaeon]|nr:MBL fold metallo-hydrolase [Candidatus Woesearchaeota archaeon]
MEKIVFLGTGGDAIAVAKQLLGSGGVIIQVDDTQLHLDPGPGALVKASEYNINARNTTAVLVSHAHLNHAHDTNAIISAMSLAGMDIHGVVVANKTVIDGDEKHSKVISDFHKSCVEKIIPLEAGQKIGINNIEIRGTNTKHNETYALGFRITTQTFDLGYTGDTGYTTKLGEDFRGVDILILNVQYPGDQKRDFQLCSAEAMKIINEVNPRLAIITHFGIKMIQSDPINEARNIQRTTGVQTIAAKDGMVINPVSYMVNLRQKPVKMF